MMKQLRSFPVIDALGAAGLVLLAAGLVLSLDRSALTAWRTTRSEVRALGDAGGRSDAVVLERERLENEIGVLRQAAGRAVEGLPSAMESFLVLEDLGRVSRECRVTLDHVVPGNINAGKRFATIPVELTLRGAFHSLLRFLARVESGEHPVRVQRVSLSRDAPSADMNLEASLAVSCLTPEEKGKEEAKP